MPRVLVVARRKFGEGDRMWQWIKPSARVGGEPVISLSQ